MVGVSSRREKGIQGPKVKIGRHFAVDPQAPVPELDSATAQAFRASGDGGRRGGELIAHVCRSELPARSEILSSLRQIDEAVAPGVQEWATVDWPPDQARRFVVICERPAGPPLMTDMQARPERMNEEALTRRILSPIFQLLQELGHRGLYCGGIRLTNLHLAQAKGSTVELGEFFTTPAGYDQPVLFEPIERAMADPVGRGPGEAVDDLYALGVSCVMLVLGHNPAQDRSGELSRPGGPDTAADQSGRAVARAAGR